MADGNLDLPEELFSSKPAGEAWAGKDALIGGKDGEKNSLGFLDEAKDQVNSENSIPLSPQWLYSKPSENKDSRPLGSVSSGNFPDSIQKDMWRLDGSQDVKEWRRNTTDIESSRRWREEERESLSLGRRERKKEGDRETDYRKNDRRPDSISMREVSDSKTSSDRLPEVPNRITGGESRRDSKWSTRWGPEDKEKEPWADKKVDVEKGDSHIDKQSFTTSLRPLSGVDSRDKWRPRHRQEVQASSSPVIRAAPGFGSERGHAEGPNVGFARGRGRVDSVSGSQADSSSAARPIGATSSNKVEFKYPRAKLLDIYRKQIVLIIDGTPEGLEKAPPITEPCFIIPLAFLTPEEEEEVLLKDIWKGKVTSSEVSSNRQRVTRINESEIDGEMTLMEQKHVKEPLLHHKELNSDHNERKENINAPINLVGPDGLSPKDASDDVFHDKTVSDGNVINYETNVRGIEIVNNDKKSSSLDILMNNKSREDSTDIFNIGSMLSDRLDPSFDLSSNETEKKHLAESAFPEELSLFYLDPQGQIQGPFLGEDILSWLEQGFFGTDLPVRLFDAPDGMPFRPLGEIITYLKPELHSISSISPSEKSEPLDIARGNLEVHISSPHLSGSFPANDHQLAQSRDALHQVKYNLMEKEIFADHNKDKLSSSNSEIQLGRTGDFSGQDGDAVTYRGRPRSNMEDQSGKLANDNIVPSRSTSGHHINHSSVSHNISRGYELNPLGLSWSELEGTDQKFPLSSTIRGSAENLMGHYDSAMPFPLNQENFSSVNSLLISDHRSRSSNTMQDILNENDLSQFEAKGSQFDLEQHLLLQQLQEQLQHQSLLEHQNVELPGTFLDQLRGSMHQHHPINQQPIEDLEQMLFQIEQQQQHHLHHLDQLQQQRHLEQLQQHHLEQLQQQHRLEQLQQQRRLEQLQQQRHLEQLQQQRHLEQLRQRELDQLQQQQQQQHQLHHRQQLHDHQMQLLRHRLEHHEPQLLASQQMHLENFLQRQLLEPGFGASNIDPHMINMIDQAHYRQQLLNALQQPPRNQSVHHDSAMEQLIQANLGQNFQGQNHNDLLEVLANSKQGQVPLEHLLGLQLEQLQAQELANAQRRLPRMEEDRHIGGVWAVDESGQFIRTASSQHQNYSARLSQLDLMQTPQEASHLQGDFMLHERMQSRGSYEQELDPHIHSGIPGSSLEVLNALAQLQMDAQEHGDHLHSSGRVGTLPSNAHTHPSQISEDFTGPFVDRPELHWSESSRNLSAGFMESHLKQLQIEAEKHHDINMSLSAGGLTRRASHVGSGGPEYGSRDLLHPELLRSQGPLGLVDVAPTLSYEERDPSWLYSRPGSENSSNFNADRSGLSCSMAEGSLFADRQSLNEPANKNLEGGVTNFEVGIRSNLRSGSSSSLEQNLFLSEMSSIEKENLMNSTSHISLPRLDFSNLKEGERERMSLKGTSKNRSTLAMQESVILQAVEGGHDVEKLFRHDPSGKAGGGASFYNYETGPDLQTEEMANNKISGDPSKSASYSLAKRNSHAASTAAMSDLVSSQPAKEGKRDSGRSSSPQSSETPISNKKDVRIRRTSSSNDADVMEPSFSDMLKSTKKPEPENQEGGSVGKNVKRKGKKGRQIDPSLLGFKVHSNRILMGEIQRPDD